MIALVSIATALLGAQTGDAPAGFKPVDGRAILRLDPNDLKAPGWMVTLENDRLRIETRVAWVKRMHQAPPIRDGQTVDLGTSQAIWKPGMGTRVSDGWIEGYDGKFGGGLYWFAKDGKTRRRLSEDNTLLVIRTSKGIFAIQALTRPILWYGRLVKVSKGPQGWGVQTITDLHVNPFPVQDGDRFIYAESPYVSTLETDGTQREIYRSFSEFRTQSIVRRRNGEVWIGSLHGLLRLRPKPGGDYDAQWFLPKAP